MERDSDYCIYLPLFLLNNSPTYQLQLQKTLLQHTKPNQRGGPNKDQKQDSRKNPRG